MTEGMTAPFLAFCACLLLVRAAGAEPREPSNADLELARGLFSDATALEGRADWAAATAKLKRALAIKETPGLRYHLAHCEEQTGSLVLAAADYQRAAELIRDGAPAPDVEPLLPLAARRLDSRIAKLELVVPPGTSAVAELDGRVLPPSAVGASVRLDPGAHRVVVRAPGRGDYNAELTLATGERRTLKLFFGPERSPAGVSRASRPPRANAESAATAGGSTVASRPGDEADGRAAFGTREVVLVGEAALALAGVGVGIGYAVVRHGATGRIDAAQRAVDSSSAGAADACYLGNAVPACAALTQAIDDHQRAATIEIASFVGAGAATGLLAATWTLWPSSPRGVAVTITPRASGAELLAGGVF